jgi:polyhydroxyalkanoate synthesis regulator phasin
MSPLSLLVVASVAAAVAFFVAGLLIRRPHSVLPSAPDPQAEQLAALGNELASLQALHRKTSDALDEATRRQKTEAWARQDAESAQHASEQECASAKAECQRLTAREYTLAERLRAAEGHGQAALEQVENNAAAWDARWHAVKAEHEGQDQAIRQELAQLRDRFERQTKAKEEAELRERNLRADFERSLASWQDKHARAETDWQATLASRQAAWDAKMSASESAWQAMVEDAGLAQQSDESTQRTERHELLEQVRQLHEEQSREREQSQHLELALRTAEETLATERAETQAATLALRTAENRLRDWDRLTRENAELRDEQARTAEEAKWAVDRNSDTRDTKVELAAAQAKLAELGEALQENRRLRDEVAGLRMHQSASDDLERLTVAHKQLRLDAELMARRLTELQHDHVELAPLQVRVAEAAGLAEEVAYLRQREKDLEAQLYASGSSVKREMPAMVVGHTPVSSMEGNLDSLLGEAGPRTAVLADAQGFLIAGAGETFTQEGLAAFAAVAGEMVARARMLLPLAAVNAVRVIDANSMVLTCHLFDSDGQGLEIATLGPGEPPAENTQRAIGHLAATISGAGHDGSTED